MKTIFLQPLQYYLTRSIPALMEMARPTFYRTSLPHSVEKRLEGFGIPLTFCVTSVI
jgi:hypothetical protein